MKTTKKGFTLIELIVVIAIIGVLAAILVPSMLGYVKKSKIQSANSTASSIFKAVNSAATEFEEEDIGITDGLYTLNGSSVAVTPATGDATLDEMWLAIKNYFGDVTKVKDGKFQVSGGMCCAVACKSGKYLGTYPSGVVTAKNWNDWKDKDTSDALAKAVSKAGS
ncbi:MAG: type II secretion system protein [Oscillospiraceae bacterium]|nr:type II secretion system protein [Oscillospiraceae bacterium]